LITAGKQLEATVRHLKASGKQREAVELEAGGTKVESVEWEARGRQLEAAGRQWEAGER
jgi:hypothetical protein